MMILVQRSVDSGGGPWRAEAHIASLDGDEPFATALGSNPLGAAAPVPNEALRGPRVVLPSGWLEDDDEGSGVDPRTWGPRGWAGFEAICRGLCEQVRGRSTRVCFRPRATDVLSDVPSCLRFLENKASWGDEAGVLGLLLDPAAMLAPSMLAAAEDHIHRILEQLADASGVVAVMLTNVELSTRGPGPMRPSPLHRGSIPSRSLADAARSLVPPETPIVLLAEELEMQRSLLRG